MLKWLCRAVLLLCLGLSYTTEGRGIEIATPCKAISFSVKSPVKDAAIADTLKPHKHKFIAAVLAFPFPCGVFGLHRLYLGSSNAMPLVYVATVGGGFAILPFIDFVLIVLSRDVNTYAHNTRLFMWTKKPTVKQ